MLTRFLRNSFPVFVLALAVTRDARAHFDIFIARPAGGTKTVVGGADVDHLIYDDVNRVFGVELGAIGGEFLALEPGLNHPNINNPGLAVYPSSAGSLQPGDVMRVNERDFSVDTIDDLFYWNGSGAVSFSPAVADFRVDGGDPLGSTAGAGGEFDDHPFLVVDSDALPGVYLASVFGVVNNYDPSDPLYLVMGTEELITPQFLGITQGEFDMLTDEDLDFALEQVIDRGVAYVQTNVVVPEPASLTLVSLGFALIAASRNHCQRPASRRSRRRANS